MAREGEADRSWAAHFPVMAAMDTHRMPSSDMYPESHFQVQSGLESSQEE